MTIRNLSHETHGKLVGGFNPSEKYQSKWESSPNRGENKKYLKPQPRKSFVKIYAKNSRITARRQRTVSTRCHELNEFLLNSKDGA